MKKLGTFLAALAALVCLAAFAFGESHSGSLAGAAPAAPAAEPGAGGERALYVCLDDNNPCLADTAEGCSDCATGAQKKPFELEGHMEVMNKAAALLQEMVKRGETSGIGRLTGIIRTVAARTPQFEPERNLEEIDRFRELAGQLGDQAGVVEESAAKGDRNTLTRSFRALAATCSSCHQSFRLDEHDSHSH